jgi:predicted RNA-binding protein
MLVFYVIPKKISGLFEVISEPFESHDEIFGWGEFGRKELFPYRVKVKTILIPKEHVKMEPLIEKLEFIKNKYLWSIHLKRAMQPISKMDYELINKACKKAAMH